MLINKPKQNIQANKQVYCAIIYKRNQPGQKGKFAALPLVLSSGGPGALRREEEFLAVHPA